MSWDDEEFDVPTTTKSAVVASWEDEEDDEPILDSWDVDEEEEARKKAEAEALKKAEKEALKARQKAALDKKKGIKSDPKLMEMDELDEETRRELLKQAELSADLNNAADLFGGLGIADINEHPRAKATAAAAAAAARKPVFGKDTPLDSHPVMQPTNKAEYEKLRKTLGPILTQLADDNLMNYTSGLAIDLIRDLSGPLSVESVRKVVSTLNVLIKDKERQERQARLSRTGGTSTGGAGKKKAKAPVKSAAGSFKKDDNLDTTNYDDFEEDDFM